MCGSRVSPPQYRLAFGGCRNRHSSVATAAKNTPDGSAHVARGVPRHYKAWRWCAVTLDIGHCRAFCRTVSRYFATQPYRIRHCFPFQFPAAFIFASGSARRAEGPAPRLLPARGQSQVVPRHPLHHKGRPEVVQWVRQICPKPKFVKSSPRATVRPANGFPRPRYPQPAHRDRRSSWIRDSSARPDS